MFQVVKRDGEIAEFRLDKIAEAVKKAFDATENEYSSDMLDLLALRVPSPLHPPESGISFPPALLHRPSYGHGR